MSRRRRQRKPMSKKERAEIKRRNRNNCQRENYRIKQRKTFFVEYSRICKKYGCFIWGNLSSVHKVNRTDKIYTIKSHLEGLEPERN